MSFYPSLEDLEVDTEAKEQVKQQNLAAAIAVGTQQLGLTSGDLSAPGAAAAGSFYGGLGLEDLMSSYGGLDISERAIAHHFPDTVQQQQISAYRPLAAVTPAGDLGMARSEIHQGVKMVTLAKNADGKLGIAVQAIDKGIFVAFVWRDSAASLGGLRFGDQILQINGVNVAGWTMKQTLKALREAEASAVKFAVRERPFARVVTMQKDSHNVTGFVYKHGAITKLVKDSSAARNGLLINHQILEVNGQCVVGLKDKELKPIFDSAPPSMTLTIMPAFIYKHMVEKIGFKKIKKYMEHKVPTAAIEEAM